MSKQLLNVECLTKSFGNKTVLDNLSFCVNEGEILGILGPNGAGKSTAFNIISGLLGADSGKVFFSDNDINMDRKKYKANIGVVPQEISLYEGMTILENLRFLGKLYGVRGKKLKERVEDLIADVKLTDRKHSEIGKLSGGMKRRINIAAAIVHSPKLVIMDEPTVGIDPQSRELVWDIIKELKERGMSIIITSHYVDEIERLSDRVLIINSGKVIADGTANDLIDKYCKSRIYTIEFYTMSNQIVKEMEAVPGVESIDINESTIRIITNRNLNIIEKLIKITTGNKAEIRNIDIKKPGLEDVFFYFTGKGLKEP